MNENVRCTYPITRNTCICDVLIRAMPWKYEVDRGISWCVLAAATFNGVVALGTGTSCSVYVAIMIHHFESSRMAGYLLGALSLAGFYIVGPATSYFIALTSHRVVAIFGGLLASLAFIISANVSALVYFYVTFCLAAIGLGLTFQVSVIAVVFYFSRYRPIANASVLAGGGLGLLVHPVLCIAIVDHYSWQSSFYIVAAVCLQTCVGSCLITPNLNINAEGKQLYKEHCKNTESQSFLENHQDSNVVAKNLHSINICQASDKKKPQPSLWKISWFWLLLINCALWMGQLGSIQTMFADLFRECNFTSSQTYMLFLLYGVFNVIGRVSSGLVLNVFRPSLTCYYCFVNFVWAGTIALFCIQKTFTILAIAITLYAVFCGACVSLYCLLNLELVGPHYVNISFGFTHLALGLSGLITPPLIGMVYDRTRNYNMVFVIYTMLTLLSAAAILPPVISHKKNISRTETDCL